MTRISLPKFKVSNNVMASRYALTKDELRILFAIYSREVIGEGSLTVKELASLCNLTGNDIYGRVRRATERLRKRMVDFKKKSGTWISTKWLRHIEYVYGEGRIKYMLSEKMRAETLDVKAGFLVTLLDSIMHFASKNTARFYLFLKSRVKLSNFTESLDWVRDRLMLSKSYRLLGNLKNRILEPVLKEINEKTDIQVQHTYVKRGRSFEQIRFSVHFKTGTEAAAKAKAAVEARVEMQEVRKPSLSEDAEKLAKTMMSAPWQLNARKTYGLLKKHGEESIRQNLRYARMHVDNKKNAGGWLIYCIENNLGVALAKEEQAKLRQQQQAREARLKLEAKQQKEPPRPAPSFVREFAERLRRGETMDEAELAKLMHKELPPKTEQQEKSVPMPPADVTKVEETKPKMEGDKNTKVNTLQSIIASLANKLSMT